MIRKAPIKTKSKQTQLALYDPNIKYTQEIQYQLFATEYLIDYDPISAAIRTNLIPMDTPLYKQQSMANKLLQNPYVKDAIKNALEYRLKRLQATEDKIVAELSSMAFFNVSDIVDENGDVKKLHTLPRHISGVIQELEYKVTYKKGKSGIKEPDGHATKVKLYDKLSSLKALLQYINGEYGNKNRANYEQLIINNTIQPNRTELSTLNLSEFSDEELKVLRKMTDSTNIEYTTHDIIELERLETNHLESN